MDFELQSRVDKDLWPCIRDGKCVAWVGAGLSVPADYPGWQKTIEILCKGCGVTPLKMPNPRADQLMDKADECKAENLEIYCRTLGEIFGKSVVATRHAYSLLMQLPFKGYVTTNYDPLLATAAEDHNCRDLYCYPSLLVSNLADPKAVFYIHGFARDIKNEPNGNNLVLARSEFQDAYKGPVDSFLYQMLLEYDVLFIGCGLSEPAISTVFERVHDIHVKIQGKFPDANFPNRWSILPSHRNLTKVSGIDTEVSEQVELEEVRREEEEEGRLGELGIKVFRYLPSTGTHPEIEGILKSLRQLAETSPPLVPRVGFGEELQR